MMKSIKKTTEIGVLKQFRSKVKGNLITFSCCTCPSRVTTKTEEMGLCSHDQIWGPVKAEFLTTVQMSSSSLLNNK